MRFVVLAFITLTAITACGPKVKTFTPPRAKTSELNRTLKTSEALQNKYSKNTESLFALLWPLEFTSENKSLLSKSLKVARELQTIRKNYTSIATRLKKSSNEHQCECVLMGICETEINPAQQEESLRQCTKIENEQIENDERLGTLFSLQEDLKNSVLEMGGHWLETSTPAEYDFSTEMIDFKDAEFFNKEGERFGLSSADAFWKLDSVKIDGALQAQGELRVRYAGQLYRGELGFQLPERGD